MCLLVGCIAPPQCVQQSDHLFSLGTYQKGNNITEPRPQESKYLRTRMGGFEIIQGFAGLKLYIDVIKKPDQRLYTKAIIPNPKNSNAPFVYEHYIDPNTPSTTLTQGPMMGLEIYQDYLVEFILYSDEARSQEVDRLSQKIRSYVDTTGDKLKLFGNMKPKSF
jgi:hypothetical protein